MVGAVIVNKSPVNSVQATPIARLQGKYSPWSWRRTRQIETLDDLIKKFEEILARCDGGFALGSPDHILSGLVVKAAGGDVAK